MKKLYGMIMMAILVMGLFAPGVLASPTDAQGDTEPARITLRSDNRPDPLTTHQLDLKAKAMEAVLHGKAGGKVHEAARGQFVELEREGEGVLWTVLGEFADLKHNQLPEPDRTVDNTTIWVPDFNQAYYMDMLFNPEVGANSMRNFYIEQSSNRYTVHGDVTDWVSVPGEAATYDDDFESPLGGNQVWYFLKDSVNGWYAAQIAAGKTAEEINAYLSQFDVWDRYDFDGDGNFAEPDGYIDTFQSVHAGLGNEACSPTCDDWAIWSHSWYAFYGDMGDTGPAFNLMGGIQIGASDYWVGKYTIQPENGGVGVFAHEFGHDLGLPDLYDYYGNNAVGFWSVMASGSWLSDGTVDIGSKPSHMGAWEKSQLGWLNYEVAYAGETSEHTLGPSWFNTRQAQGLFVVLPEFEVTADVGTPYAGQYFYYSGQGNNIDQWMFKPFTLAAGSLLTAKVNYDIELDWDYAYLVVSTDGGATWTSLETNLSTTTDPNGQNYGFGITGTSDGWVDLTANLPAGDVLLGFRYWTDGAVVQNGFSLDELTISGYDTDGAEVDAGWTFDGFKVTTGIDTNVYSHYYVAEFRQYGGYDNTLKTGPYSFIWPLNHELANWVDHFPYQDGLLINYWNTSVSDNDVANHLGQGLLLPIDAHPDALYRSKGDLWGNHIQTYDSTFTLGPTDAITLHYSGSTEVIPSLPGVRLFDDNNLYYDPANPSGSVLHPHTGTQIWIKSMSGNGTFMKVVVRPAE